MGDPNDPTNAAPDHYEVVVEVDLSILVPCVCQNPMMMVGEGDLRVASPSREVCLRLGFRLNSWLLLPRWI